MKKSLFDFFLLNEFFLIKIERFLNERNCKWCFDGRVFFLSELILNRILIVNIIINKTCSKLESHGKSRNLKSSKQYKRWFSSNFSSAATARDHS